jgi:hypothetical protein
MVPISFDKKVLMNLDKFVKKKEHIFLCPMCSRPLTVNNHTAYLQRSQTGYDCFNCTVPGAITDTLKPYSRYTIAVMKDIPINENVTFEQIIVHETFVVPYKEKQWYNVHNNLIKSQTIIALVEPARQEHIVYDGETPIGLVHVGNLIYFPFIDSWNLSDQEGTLSKIKTYLLFS